jgi:glycosyltransferase involved in cell wall biosynthesis
VIIHQMGSTAAVGDAITNDIIQIDRALRGWGFDTRIYATDISEPLRGTFLPDSAYSAFQPSPDDILLYHYSVFWENMKMFKASRNRKVFIYHNITPPEFFAGYDNYLESLCSRGRASLGEMRDCDVCVGDSEYNRQELVEHGFDAHRSTVLPIYLQVDDYGSVKPNQELMEKYRDSANILFVGRTAPNKRFEDVIKAFYFYCRHVNPDSYLFLIGARFIHKYNFQLDDLIDRLGLRQRIVFPGKVSLADLKTYYLLADLFLCMSEHEGFCVPLVESMHFDVPILTYKSSAIPGTLGGSGVMFLEKRYEEIAEMMGRMIGDDVFRDRIIAGQRKRFSYFQPENVEALLKNVLKQAGAKL